MRARAKIVNVPDARRLARRSIPRPLFDYIDGGADGEVTMAENEQVFTSVTFRPRMGVNAEQPCLDTIVLGTSVSLPVILAPCGLVQALHPDGAVGVARSANRAGTIAVHSTFSGLPPEALAPEPGPRWFQLYASDRHGAEDLIGRAAASKFDALVVTVDSPTVGKRERDLHHGIPASSFRLSPKTAVRFAPQVITRPRWLLRTFKSTLSAVNSAPMPENSRSTDIPKPRRSPKARRSASSSSRAPIRLVSPCTWDDIAWIRDEWSGPLIVKGVLSGEDAVASVEAGADAVIVSNHGGRQLDGAPATLSVLPEVVEAVGARCDILIDGGVRRGGDVVKALALGAQAVLIGLPYLYALAASGEAGVDRILKIFHTDMRRTMLLMGCHSVADLDRSWIRDVPATDPWPLRVD